MIRALLLLLALCVSTGLSMAKDTFAGENVDSLGLKHPLVHRVGVSVGADYVASSMEEDLGVELDASQKINVNTALPVNLRYSFSFSDPSVPHYLPGGYQGVGVGVLNLGGAQAHGSSRSNHNIGYPVLAYVFQGGPFHHFNRRMTLDYEWNFGAAIGWKPFGEENKNFNLIVGSRVNAYLNLGLTFNWQLDRHTSLFGGVVVSHFSNGNTSYPNPGVNSFGVRIGMNWTLNPQSEQNEPASTHTAKEERKRKVEYDVMAWGATRKRLFRGIDPPVLMPGHYACAGISFMPMVWLNDWWRVGGSLDLQWDRSSDMKNNYINGDTTETLKFSTPSFWRQATLGISAHGELRMPVFAVNVGCGYNLVAPWENKGFYQNIALKAYIYKGLFLNIGYQLRNFHQQSSLMLGAGVSI